MALNQKKQLTADERRCTLRNKRLGTNLGLTKKVGREFSLKIGFICVHLRVRRLNCRF
jgi:hypothetical protein